MFFVIWLHGLKEVPRIVLDELKTRWHTHQRRKRHHDILSSSGRWLFSRTACLGNDLLDALNPAAPVLNIQKGRLDWQMRRLTEGEGRSAYPTNVRSVLDRKDIWPLIVDQEIQWWDAVRPPDLWILDSYSELTDQMFRHSDGDLRFCANYSDVTKHQVRSSIWRSEGLLPMSEIPLVYENAVREIQRIWPETPILFVNFPTVFEERSEFRNRAWVIEDSITRLSQDIGSVSTLTLSDELCTYLVPEGYLVDFAYHYPEEVTRGFVDRVKQLMARDPAIREALRTESA